MARLARLTLPGRVHLVTHRGNNRQPVFVDDEDRQKLLDLLGEQAVRHRVTVHAYVLLPGAIYLLLTPETDQGVPALMQAIGRTYVRHFNARHGRSGTLWEGRYRSTLIQPERHLFACMSMMDSAPVREGLCAEPFAYAWSSHRHHIGQAHDRRLTPHPLYWSLGNTPFAREAAYAELVHRGLDLPQLGAITDAVWHGWALGDSQFVDSLQRDTARRLAPARPGRPPKQRSVG
ncbi:transposase [Hydrogenophaga sp. MI9]|uniref:transposase n=1 Tax=Hydrogenophaga sp. MI9 TaxID=3453719 RepID=UPI003EEC9A64